MGIIIYLNCYNHKHKLQIYQSCKEKMGGGGGAIACARQEQTQCHLCRSEHQWLSYLVTKLNNKHDSDMITTQCIGRGLTQLFDSWADWKWVSIVFCLYKWIDLEWPGLRQQRIIGAPGILIEVAPRPMSFFVFVDKLCVLSVMMSARKENE